MNIYKFIKYGNLQRRVYVCIDNHRFIEKGNIQHDNNNFPLKNLVTFRRISLVIV